jgi:hypothetical protein
VFSKDGRLIRSFSTGIFSAVWSLPQNVGHRFRDCEHCAIALNGSGNIFVVDSSNRCVREFRADGTFVSSFGPNEEHFLKPVGICVDKRGRIFVTDSDAGRVSVFVM